jgi:hypothetical protein
MSNVLFNNARGAASSLQMSPPFSFSDVTMSVFPLRASLPSLENFTRNYLNQAPDLVQFQPFVPFVYLVILDYGRMSLEAANMGWVSQREVAFGIPLRWMNGGETGPQFHDWAFSSPFIFVDNELSMSTGREVYGWPKLLARLDPSVSEWVHNPHGARRVFQVSTKGAAEAYAGETSAYRPLLSVYQHRTAGLLDMPPNLDSVLKPLGQMSSSAAGFMRLGRDLAQTFAGMASDRITGSSVLPDMMDMDTLKAQLSPERQSAWRSAKDWMPGIKDALWSLFPRMYANTINFKQFRDAANPHATCYQALTAARMPVKAFKQGGFLGPQNMLMGQLDGGFRIDVHHLAGLPIVESLGLEVSEEREAGGSVVHTLSPVAPLWMKVDMTYGVADTLIWRGREGGWREGDVLKVARAASAAKRAEEQKQSAKPQAGPTPQTPQTGDQTAPQQTAHVHHAPPIGTDGPEEFEDGQGFDYIRAMNFFNTARGASEAVGGSFSVPDASVRVLPLKADAATLQNFVRDYLRVQDCMKFEAWGDFVYLVISDFKQMNSELSALAKRRARELSLLVPVKCYKWHRDGAYPTDKPGAQGERGRERLLTTGFVNAFTYVDDVETAITANEVFGVPSMGSTIRASENEWLSRDYGTEQTQHEILTMSAQVLPELMAGAQAVGRTLVDVSTHQPHHPAVQETQDESVNRWLGVLANDLATKYREAGLSSRPDMDPDLEERIDEGVCAAQGFALKILGGDNALNQFSLKQFRDSHDTNNACYQGLILRRHQILKLNDFREIDAPLHVSITDYPTQPITEILGLKPKFSYPGKDRLVKVFEAVRPFSLNADLRRGTGVTLFERVGSERWHQVDITEQMFGWRKIEIDQIEAFVDSIGAEEKIELAYARHVPGSGITTEKRPGRVGQKYLRLWYEKRVQRGHVSSVFIRQRSHPEGVKVLTDAERLNAPRRADGLDVAAWNAQMVPFETGFAQSALAETLEYFSPATILDKALSRKWGLARGTALPKFAKPDYCLPVCSAPPHYAETLFPAQQSHAGFWPQSGDHYGAQLKKREREAMAFKVELKSAIHMFALLYPGVLMRTEEHSPPEEWTFEKAIVSLAETLNSYLDDDQLSQTEKTAKEALRDIKGDEDIEGIMKATEDVVVQFVDVHLPEPFKLTEQAYRKTVFERMMEGAMPLISSQDWLDVHEALKLVRQKVEISLGGEDDLEQSEEMQGVAEYLDPFIARAQTNHDDMKMMEQLEPDMPYPSPVSDPAGDLRRRLKALFSGEDTSND